MRCRSVAALDPLFFLARLLHTLSRRSDMWCMLCHYDPKGSCIASDGTQRRYGKSHSLYFTLHDASLLYGNVVLAAHEFVSISVSLSLYIYNLFEALGRIFCFVGGFLALSTGSRETSAQVLAQVVQGSSLRCVLPGPRLAWCICIW